ADGFNGHPPDGFGFLDFNIWKGRRWTAVAAYLRPALRRANLTTVTDSIASSITIERGRATGVEWLGSEGTRQVRAGREVIVSAGAIGSTRLLLLSGVGDAEELRRLDIAVSVDLPGVGRNLQNHPDVALRHACPAPVTLHSLLRAERIIPAMARALLLRSGPATSFPGESAAFLRSAPELDRPDLQCHLVAALRIGGVRFANPFARGGSPLDRDGFSVRIILLRPQSRGRVSLASADPLAPPLIRHNYLGTPTERGALMAGVRLMRNVLAQPPFDPWRGAELEPGPGVQSD